MFSGVPESWLVVPEGNGKTTLFGGLALYHCEFRPFAAVPIAASSREQSEIMYRQAEGFVLRSPRMYEPVHSSIQAAKGKRKTDVPRFLCLEGYRRINHHAGGRIQVFAADDRTGDGIIPTLGLLDELHRHRNLNLYRTWVGKLQKRGGQIGAISTSGEPGSEFEVTREKIRQEARDVTRLGSFVRARSNRLVLHEWAVPEDVDPEDFPAVKRANPFTGVTVESLTEKFASPTMTMEHWLRFVCNRPTRTAASAITETEWAAAKTATIIPDGTHVDVGLDVAWKYDTTAAVPLWLRDLDHRLLGPASILTPPRDGSMLDGRLIEKALRDIHERTPIDTLVMDLSRAESVVRWAEETLGCEVIDWPQTNTQAVEDFVLFMEGLREGHLQHSGDVGLTQHAMNAIAYQLPLGDTRFERPKQGRNFEQERRVIDALQAASMVHSFAVRQAQAGPEAMAAPNFF